MNVTDRTGRPPLSPQEGWLSDGQQVLHFKPLRYDRWSQALEPGAGGDAGGSDVQRGASPAEAPQGTDTGGGDQALDPEAPAGVAGLFTAVEPASASVTGLIRIEAMELYADLSQRRVLDTNALAWMPSPMAGVERRMLDRRGEEVARATSIVRYAPGSRFERHVHGGGEEILLLEGTFSDEHGDYPAGTYLRNPAGSKHAPFSDQGCTLLVKLHQKHPDDQQRPMINTTSAALVPGLVRGLEVMPLHAFGSELVALVRWAPGTVFQLHGHPGREEFFVLAGRHSLRWANVRILSPAACHYSITPSNVYCDFCVECSEDLQLMRVLCPGLKS